MEKMAMTMIVSVSSESCSPAAAFNPEVDDALGEARKRNPEYAPFETPALRLVARAAAIGDLSHSRSLMYAIKAGVMTAVTTLPAFLM